MSASDDMSDWVSRLRGEIHGTAAVILKGSHARGAASWHSDVDFDVLVQGNSCKEYLAFFEEDDSSRIRHVSVAVQDVAGWIDGANEPVSWSYGLAAAETTMLLWARDDELWRRLDQPARMHPPEEPELEDFIEAWGKIRNAYNRGDELAMRVPAQKLARLCPTLLRPLNPDVAPSNRLEAMRAVLEFPVAPVGYRADLLCCSGLSGEMVSPADLLESARRLTLGTVDLLMEHLETVRLLLPDDLAKVLADGLLARYIRQTAGGN